MTTTNGTQIKAVSESWVVVGALCGRGANVWRSSLQTLLVAAGCGGVLGLLSGRLYRYPGSPRRGSADPGLYSAAPLGLVCGGAMGREMARSMLRQRILVNNNEKADCVTVEKVIGKLLEIVKV